MQQQPNSVARRGQLCAWILAALCGCAAALAPAQGASLRTAREQQEERFVTVTVVMRDGGAKRPPGDYKAVFAAGDFLLAGPVRVGETVFARVRTTPERARELAADARVRRVLPWTPPRPNDERTGAIMTGAFDAAGRPGAPGYRQWLASKGLDGPLPVVVDVTDSGFDKGSTTDVWPGLTAPDGASRVVYARDFTNDQNAHDVSGHGTINASIVAGSALAETDADGFAYGLGVAPGARVGSTRIFADDGLFDVIGNYSLFTAAAWRDGARVSSNSWGSPSSMYDPDAIEYDALVRDADPDMPGAQEMVVVFSAGNYGPDGHIDTPATAKNVITVGAAEGVRAGSDGCGVGATAADSALDMAFFSGGGPVGDGRVKPDLVAPGTHVVGARSRADGYTGSGICDKGFPGSPELYAWSSGTSHAAPAVAGAAALLYTKLERDRGAAPTPALVKAWLTNSTRYLTGTGAGDDLPSQRQGWGLVDLERAFDDAPRVVVDRPAVFKTDGESREWVAAPADAARPVRLTLVWTDAPGDPGGVPQVNDLDLEVEANGQLYRGNRFARDASVAGGVPDTRNNVEGVWLPAGSGPVRVRVRATALRGDGVPGNNFARDQDFALVGYNLVERAAPLLRVSSATVESDSGALEPGSSALVRITIANDGTAVAPATSVSLVAPSGGLASVLDGPEEIAALAPGASATLARAFRVAVDARARCGEPLGLAARAGAVTIPLGIDAGGSNEAAIFEDDVESGARWTTESESGGSPWGLTTARARSGASSWFAPGFAARYDASIVSPPIEVPADALATTFSFWHTYEYEAGYDGGVAEVSIDGGPFVDAGVYAVEGAYPANVIAFFGSPLGTRGVWTGGRLGDWRPVRIDLAGLAGRTVRFRLRAGTDSSDASAGWYVDDLRVTARRPACGATGGGDALPRATSVQYKNGRLKLKGSGLSAATTVEINGRAVRATFAYRADKNVLKAKAGAFDLNLRVGGFNTVVLRENGRAGASFAFAL